MTRHFAGVAAVLVLVVFNTRGPSAQAQFPDRWKIADANLAAYFRAETAKLRDRCLADIQSLDEWKKRRGQYLRQLREMLGLEPLPKKSDLKAKVTGVVEHGGIRVEKLHFQSLHGLYVTANLYLPAKTDKPAPAVLYVCGHGRVKIDGVSYGNKVHYHHHGAWFARNGYACLTIDSLQLGEIEGLHHGTYRHGMWWWNNRGYTPAGVEAWNCIRAIDYLQSRPEVDGQRIGVTGRSGGGAYSWWIAALDQRIKCAVPVAGITDLQNHVVDGCVEGHCDCMYLVNTYRWDYPVVAALVAPRPLLISNTDNDRIFPLDGVVRVHEKVRRIYRLYGAEYKLGLHVTSGPHKDTQELRVGAFRWLDKHLRGKERPIEDLATKVLDPKQLKVFDKLPGDSVNSNIQESFTPPAPPPAVPKNADQWSKQREEWLAALREKSFGGWPETADPLRLKLAFSKESQGVRLAAYDFESQQHVPLRLYVAQRAGLAKPKLVVLNVLDEEAWQDFLATYRPAFADVLPAPAAADKAPGDKAPGDKAPGDKAPGDKQAFEQTQRMFKSFPWVMAYVAPRGVGPAAWPGDERKQTQIRRRFMLLGQTVDAMRVWDVRRAAAAVRALPPLRKAPLWLQSQREMAGVTLYASLFENDIARLDLHALPATHREGPVFLNVRRILDVPQAVALAANRWRVVLYHDKPNAWKYPRAVVEKLGWDAKRFAVRKPVD